MKKADKKEFTTDAETGVRNLRVIKSLPVSELTDEEIVKLFFARWQADSLLFYYQDKQGEKHLFGRISNKGGVVERYRALLRWVYGIGYNLFHVHDVKAINDELE